MRYSCAGVDVADLYAAVYANPEDDGLRQVLADALISRGDPRGEFIQLQYDDRRDQSGARRLMQLHGMTWLGSLRGKVVPLAYERGFLAGCAIRAPGSEGCVSGRPSTPPRSTRSWRRCCTRSRAWSATSA